MPLPVAHALLGASIVAATRNFRSWREEARWWAIGAALGVLPDLDLFFSWVLGLDLRWHGGFTHSLFFAAAAGALAARAFGGGTLRATLAFTGAAFSHGLLDAATKKTFGGVELLWPFTQREIKLGWFDYFPFYPGSNLTTRGGELRRALEISGYELAIFFPLFVSVLFARRYAARPQPGELPSWTSD
jgi:membrane-bound metal-dependent hydrolase YbcI (DUF457 family)